MAQRQLAADEAELVGEIRPRAGRVAARARRARAPPIRLRTGSPRSLPEQVPEGEVDGRDRVDRQALAPVEEADARHIRSHISSIRSARSPSTKRARCRSTRNAAGTPPVETPTPTTPDSLSTSTTTEPSTSMPNDVRVARYSG